jgi:hypothetical protein
MDHLVAADQVRGVSRTLRVPVGAVTDAGSGTTTSTFNAELLSRLREHNANAGHPDVLVAQRRERARIRSECQRRSWSLVQRMMTGVDLPCLAQTRPERAPTNEMADWLHQQSSRPPTPSGNIATTTKPTVRGLIPGPSRTGFHPVPRSMPFQHRSVYCGYLVSAIFQRPVGANRFG